MKIDVGQAEVVTLRAGSLDVVLDKAKGVVRVVLPDGGVMLNEPQAHLLGRWLTELTQEDRVAEMAGPRWHEWGGGPCPVRAETPVETERRDGMHEKGLAGKFSWVHRNNNDYDIVAYRVLP